MSNSPFQDFITHSLFFKIKGVGAVLAEDTDTGNVSATIEEIVALTCTLKATSDPRVLRLIGADATQVALSGRLVEPMVMPAGLSAGLTSPLRINDKAGLFTLGPVWPGMIQAVEEALGSRIVGSWKSE